MFKDLPTEILNIKTVIINEAELNLDIDKFEEDIIIIKSTTGTGKTKTVAKNAKKLKMLYSSKILSIVNLISLSREQIKTFNEQSETILNNYQENINKLES
jgi:flagellar biosynthesis GTPase FlhF